MCVSTIKTLSSPTMMAAFEPIAGTPSFGIAEKTPSATWWNLKLSDSETLRTRVIAFAAVDDGLAVSRACEFTGSLAFAALGPERVRPAEREPRVLHRNDRLLIGSYP